MKCVAKDSKKVGSVFRRSDYFFRSLTSDAQYKSPAVISALTMIAMRLKDSVAVMPKMRMGRSPEN